MSNIHQVTQLIEQNKFAEAISLAQAELTRSPTACDAALNHLLLIAIVRFEYGKYDVIPVKPEYIYGYESPINLEILTSVLLGVEANSLFPPVKLIKISEHEYHIPYLEASVPGKDGGHHRSFAHFLTNRPVQARLVTESLQNDGGFIIPPRLKIAISDLVVESKEANFNSKKFTGYYLPHNSDHLRYTLNLMADKNCYFTG